MIWKIGLNWLSIVTRSLDEWLRKYMCVLCVPIDRTLVAWFYFSLSFFFFFLFLVSCLRYVCATANSSLELNIQLVPPHISGPTQRIMRLKYFHTNTRLHVVYFSCVFFFFRTLQSAVLLILYNNARWLDATHWRRKPVISLLSVHFFAFGQSLG